MRTTHTFVVEQQLLRSTYVASVSLPFYGVARSYLCFHDWSVAWGRANAYEVARETKRTVDMYGVHAIYLCTYVYVHMYMYISRERKFPVDSSQSTDASRQMPVRIVQSLTVYCRTPNSDGHHMCEFLRHPRSDKFGHRRCRFHTHLTSIVRADQEMSHFLMVQARLTARSGPVV